MTITAENVQFLGGGTSNGEGDPSAGQGRREEVETGEEQWEDIPF